MFVKGNLLYSYTVVIDVNVFYSYLFIFLQDRMTSSIFSSDEDEEAST